MAIFAYSEQEDVLFFPVQVKATDKYQVFYSSERKQIGRRRLNRKLNDLIGQIDEEEVFEVPGHPPKIPTPFDESLLTATDVTAVDSVKTSTSSGKGGVGKLTRNDKRLKHYLKRFQFDRSLLKSIECQILQFISSRASIVYGEDYDLLYEFDGALVDEDAADWVIEDLESEASDAMDAISKVDGDSLQFNIQNSFQRLLVHAMCRYYCCKSLSVVQEDKNVIVITIPSTRIILPDLLFSEYLLN